jgi:hypothetical protein
MQDEAIMGLPFTSAGVVASYYPVFVDNLNGKSGLRNFFVGPKKNNKVRPIKSQWTFPTRSVTSFHKL